MNPYSSLCDDFGIYVYVNTKMELPSRRETVLHFFERLQKGFPQLTDFDCRDNGDYVLEEDREQGSYRWVSLEKQRFCSGFVNPPAVEVADTYHDRVLEMMPHHLDFSPLDCEALDVLFAFDFMYQGNHDEVVAEALGLNAPLENLVQMPGTKIINYEPSLMLALDESCRLQCRLNIETRTNAYQIRTGQFSEVPISVYFTVRQYWGRKGSKLAEGSEQPSPPKPAPPGSNPFRDSYHRQRKVLQELVDNHIIPSVIQPLNRTISNKQ